MASSSYTGRSRTSRTLQTAMNAASTLSTGAVASRRRQGERTWRTSTMPIPSTTSPTNSGVPGMWM